MVCFEYAVKELQFFPRKLGCDGFPWNHYVLSDGFFSQFNVFYLFFNLLHFYFFWLSKKKGGHGPPVDAAAVNRISSSVNIWR